MRRVTGLLKRFFEHEQGRFIHALEDRLKATKALDPEDDDRIDGLLDTWDAVEAPIAHELDAIFREAARDAREAFEARDTIDLSVINQAAFDFARARAAELIGKKWHDGKLVDNPDAKWAITDTTREELKALVEQAFKEGMTPAELRETTEASGVFTPSRAEMIARTEMARAQVKGALSTAQQAGAVGKEWQTSGDHDQDDECDENEDAGIIAIDDDFPSGDDGPPAHPRCNCVLVFYSSEDPEAAELVGATESEA